MGTDDFGVQSVHGVYKKAASLNQLCKGPISKLCLSVFHIQKAQMLPAVQQVSVTCAHRLFPFLVSMKYCLVTHHHPVAYPCCRELTLCRFLPTVSECLPFTHSDFFSNLSLYIRKDDFHLSLRGSQYLFVWGRQQRDYNTYTYPGHVPSSCMYTCIPQEQVTFSISSWLEKQLPHTFTRTSVTCKYSRNKQPRARISFCCLDRFFTCTFGMYCRDIKLGNDPSLQYRNPFKILRTF